MVARLSEMPAPWFADAPAAPDATHFAVGSGRGGLALRGQLLLERASALEGISARGRGIRNVGGVALRLDDAVCRNTDNCFIEGRVFAAIGGDGSVCLRLPESIADDLIDNGLCVRAGKNLLTWPATTAYQLEVNWRILLHAYWQVTGFSAKHARRMWSEYVIQH